MSKLKIALIQMLVGADKSANVLKAVTKIEEAANQGAKLIVLPEFFNSLYGIPYFKEYSEPIPGPTTDSLANAAKRLNITLVGGSIPECCSKTGKLYNTCSCFNNQGALIGKFRKMHLFDVDIPNKITFKESDSLTPGNEPMILKHGSWSAGIGICYDVRFAEFAEVYAQNGCNLLIYPSAFNMTTGPAHWQLMAQTRAIQTQCYFAMCSPARNMSASYIAWGHSLIVDPWGEIVASTEEGEDIIYADIDINRVEEVRSMLPLRNQRRTDIYETLCRVKPQVIE